MFPEFKNFSYQPKREISSRGLFDQPQKIRNNNSSFP